MQICFHDVLSSLGIASKVNISATAKITMSLCQQYPDTAGIFLPSCISVCRGLSERRQNWKIDLYSQKANAFWKSWAGHEGGCLKHCVFGHPYSGYTFEDCPECGRSVEPKRKEDQKDYSKNLKEQAFIAKINAMRLSPVSQGMIEASVSSREGVLA